MPHIPWRTLGRLTPAGASCYDDQADDRARLLFLGLLLQTRGAMATVRYSTHECWLRHETVEVDWAGFAEVVAAELDA